MRRCLSKAAILGIALSMLASSCSDSPGPDPLPTCDTIGEMLGLARESLENKLYEHLRPGAPDPTTPGDVDFSAARALYQDAHDCDDADVTARFGLAVCDLLSLSVDPRVNDAFDEWEAYLDEHTPFERPGKNADRRLGVPLGMPGGAGSLDLPFDLVRCTALAHLTMAMQGIEPQVAEVQQILLDVVLPRVEAVVDLLDPVVADGSFTFSVSGRMQGDPYESPVEIDQTDILALGAACRVLLAGIHTAVAYDVQFPSYDEAGMLAGLNRDTGNILRLRTGGSAHLQLVPGLFLAAIDELDNAIDLLLAETDNQDDDAIRIGPDSISEQDVLNIKNDWLPEIRQSFQNNGGAVHTENWDSDWQTPEVPLMIDLHAFFTGPIQDWKLVLPPYTIVTETRPWSGHDSNYAQEEIGPIQVFVPVGYTDDSRYYSVSYYDYAYSSSYDYGVFPEFRAACDEYVDALITSLSGNQNWSGRAHFSFNHWGVLAPGTTATITISVSRSYETAATFVYVPVVTWGATTYSQWLGQWTNSSLNGLLPEMHNATDLAEIFGFTENRWKQSFVWDWTDMDTNPLPPPGP